MPTKPISKPGLHLIAECSLALLIAASSGAALAHGGSHNGGSHSGSGIQYRASNTGGNWGGKAVFHRHYRAIMSNRPPLHKAGSSHKPIVYHPGKIRPPIATVGPKKLPPSATGCPGCADPNLPPGTPIYVDDGHKHCVIQNGGYWGGCDPNIPDTGVQGRGGPDQGRHHIN